MLTPSQDAREGSRDVVDDATMAGTATGWGTEVNGTIF